MTQSTIIEPDTSLGAPKVETLSGYGAATAWALDLKTDIDEWRAGKIAWSQVSAKVLLAGPPGTGKTTWARALCNSLGIPLLATSVSTWMEPGYLGDVIRGTRRVFEEATAKAPAILFIDEFDGIGKRDGNRRDYDDWWISIMNKTLELLDGTARSEGVIIVGATNRPEAIDPAMLRSGRLEKRIDIPRPDRKALAGILSHHLGADLDRVVASAPQASVKKPVPGGETTGSIASAVTDGWGCQPPAAR